MSKIFSLALYYYSMRQSGVSHKEIKYSMDSWANECHGKKVDRHGIIEGTRCICDKKWERTI